MVQLSVEIAGLRFRNPVLSASGTFGHGLEMQYMTPPELIGGLVSKSVSLMPRAGNLAPRICETEAGFLNSIGLENHGVQHYIENVLPEVSQADTNIVTNIVGEGSADDYAELAAILDEQTAIAAFEINLSCPNVQGAKLPFATDPSAAEAVVAAVRAATSKPIFAKLSPNVTRIGEIAKGAEAGGADGITAVNTLLGMQIDWRKRSPGLANVVGGYSGVAVKPVALRCAWECARAVSIPILGCGGVGSAADVLEFMVAGCTLVQIGTASFADPSLPGRVAGELASLLEENSVSDITHLIGSVRYPDAWLAANSGAKS